MMAVGEASAKVTLPEIEGRAELDAALLDYVWSALLTM